MIDYVRTLYPNIKSLEDAFIESGKDIIGWHSTLVLGDGSALSSGCATKKENARRIAFAEAIERAVYGRLLSTQDDRFMLAEFPSTCGFASGFDRSKTMWRAICESVERWAWSKWIDDGYRLPEASPSSENLGTLGLHFFKCFDAVRYFEKILDIYCLGSAHRLRFCVALGFKDDGVFPGSRVCAMFENPWEHALVEAWRHTKIASAKSGATANPNVYLDRVRFFSRNSLAAIAAINAAKNEGQWPEFKLALLREVENLPKGIYTWRSVAKSYIGWHDGDSRRFVF